MAASLLPASAHGYRTAADDPAFKGTAKVRWEKRDVAYRIHPALPDGLELEEVRAVVERAFERWTEASGKQLRLRLEEMTDAPSSPGDGINTIQFLGDGWTARGFDIGAAALTDVNYARDRVGDWVIIEADLYINAEHHSFRLGAGSDSEARDLDSVLTHEVGHIVGLWHPCEPGGLAGAPDCAANQSFADVAMYPLYIPGQVNLAPDDVAGVDFLYGLTSCEEDGCPAGFACRAEGCQQECGEVLCAVGEFCTAEGCWPVDECYGPGCDSGCLKDSDCGELQACIGRKCVGARAPGELCQLSSDCSTAICAKEGVCLNSCADCEGEECETQQSQLTCSSAKLGMGAPCETPGQCLGGECLAGAEATNMCTRRCALSANVCPQGWRCSLVDDVEVCAPIGTVRPRGGSGCAVSASRSAGPSVQRTLATLVAWIALLRGRRTSRSRRWAERP